MALPVRALLFAALAPLLCAQNGATLSGRVVNSVTGAGIPGASFRLCPYPEGTIVQCGVTDYHARADISGAFRIAGLPDGQYTVLDGTAQGFLWINTLPRITVAGDSQFDVRLTPNANVRGRVFDPDGKPAAGARVKLDLRGEAVTNQDGEFVIENVAPGCTCILSATPPAGPAAQPAAKDGTQIVTTYYPSGITADEAGRITLTGVDASYDIHLQTAPARAIKGVVLGVDGKPAPNVTVVISHNDAGPISLIRGSLSLPPKRIASVEPVSTGDDGAFTFPPVIEGDWTLSAGIPRGRETVMGTARVSVSTRDGAPGDISDVRIQLAAPFDLEVTADWGDSTPPQTQGLALVTPIPLDPGIDPLGAQIFTGEPDQPQHFRLIPGRYFIGEGGNRGLQLRGFYAAAAILDGRDVLNQVVELSGPASIKMIYKSGGGSVHGAVEKGPGATVVLLADATPAAITGYMGRCDANGAFTIRDLPPGEYTAVAVTGSGVFVDPRTPEFVTGATREGKRVRVEAGATAQVDLRIALTQ